MKRKISRRKGLGKENGEVGWAGGVKGYKDRGSQDWTVK